VAGALSGAAVGAATGAITGAITGGDVGKGALIGAGAGLLAGLAGSYLVSLQKKQQEPREMVHLAMADMEAESAAIDRTTIAFDNLVECRERQAAQINRDLKAGAIDRTTAEQRMATVNQQYQEDLAKARGISSKVNERSDAFLQVSNTIAADSGQKQLEVQKRGPGRAARVAKVERPTTGAAVKNDKLTPIAVDNELVAKQQDVTESTISAGMKFENDIQTAAAQPPFAVR
jgi:hypothetical protein